MWSLLMSLQDRSTLVNPDFLNLNFTTTAVMFLKLAVSPKQTHWKRVNSDRDGLPWRMIKVKELFYLHLSATQSFVVF